MQLTRTWGSYGSNLRVAIERLFPEIRRVVVCIVCVAVAAMALEAKAGEDSLAAWDDPDSDADRERWERAWLDEHRRRPMAAGLDFATDPADRSEYTSATGRSGFPDDSVRPSLGGPVPACDELREPRAGLRDAEAKDCFPSIFDSYYSQRFPIRSAPSFGSPLPDGRTGLVAVPARVTEFAASSDDEVSIPDGGLRAAIIARLGKTQDDPITAAEMAGLTTLTAVGRSIADLSGLRFATGLRRVNLSRNEISDLSELAALTDLTHLYVDENLVHDVAPLRDLAKLRSLSLADNLVWDLWPLAGLTELRALDIGDNEVGNILPLRGLDTLTHLYLNDNRIEDLWPLENLRGLRVLDLRNNRIRFVSPLSAMDRLTALYLSENQVADISWLSGLASLRQLSLGGNGISDISALTRLGRLTHLDLGNNMVADLSPLSTLSELTLLSLWGNRIADISALADLSRLALLDLAANRIVDASPLQGLADLAAVDLCCNQLTRAPDLSGAIDLKGLLLHANRIADLSPLSGLTALKTLSLTLNAIEDVSPLSGLRRLDTLYLGRNEITDVSPLSELTDLAALFLSQNSLVDISSLGNLSNLRLLSLGRNAIEELPDLSQLRHLTHLWVHENKISDIQSVADLTRLRFLAASGNGIVDLRPLSALGRLEELWVSDNEIGDLFPLAGLSNLYVLSAPDNAIEDASPVANLARLTQLNLIGNDVDDLAPLSDLRRLSWLWLRDNKVADVAPLVANADFGAGDYVDLRENPLDARSISEDVPTLLDRGVVVKMDGPDLVVDSQSASDDDLETGASFTLSATVRNQGAAVAESTTLRYYRSSDSTIDTGDSGVGTDAVDRLPASESSIQSIRLTAPSSSGTYYYGACVDPVEGESNADNNCSSAVRVTVRSGGGTGAPDLVVDAPAVDDANPDAGDRIVVRATVRNRGDADSAATVLRWYRSGNSTISSNDTRVGTDTVSSLAPSSTSSESITVTVPSEAGTYYYGGCVDSVSDESNTGNNCSSGVRVSVSGGGGTDSYCRAEDSLDPGDRCDIYSTNIDFYVSSSGMGCIQSGGILLCGGDNIRHRNNSLNGQRYTLVATRSGNAWTISDVDPSPPD